MQETMEYAQHLLEGARLGRRIRRLRRRKGFHVAREFARAAKIHPTMLSLYENGKRIPSHAVADRMVSALGVSRDEFWPPLKLPPPQPQPGAKHVQAPNLSKRADFQDALSTPQGALIKDFITTVVTAATAWLEAHPRGQTAPFSVGATAGTSRHRGRRG